jgi:hypothetical protein
VTGRSGPGRPGVRREQGIARKDVGIREGKFRMHRHFPAAGTAAVSEGGLSPAAVKSRRREDTVSAGIAEAAGMSMDNPDCRPFPPARPHREWRPTVPRGG